MKKIQLTQNFEQDFESLIQELNKLPEDFGFVFCLKKYPHILKEHPECIEKTFPSINDILSKVWFENEVLTRKGYKDWNYHERSEKSSKVKELMFAPSSLMGQALKKITELEKKDYKPLSYFLELGKVASTPQTIASIPDDEMDLDFIDPIQQEALANIKQFDLDNP